MNLLAIDTATDVCSVALLRDGVATERMLNEGIQASRAVLGLIDELMTEAGLGWSAIDVLAFGHGPGAFTGVRIATGIIQGLALGLDVKVVGVSTLSAVAYEGLKNSARMDAPILVVQDARMGEIYWGCYQYDEQANLSCIADDCLTRPGGLSIPFEGDWLIAGTAETAYKSALSTSLQQGHPHCGFTWISGVFTKASAVAELAMLALNNGSEAVSADAAVPVYIRNQVTQVAKVK